MKVAFTVHGVRRGHVGVDADVGGNKRRLLDDGVEVELTTKDGRALTLGFSGADVATAERLFKPDAKVHANFTVEDDYEEDGGEADPAPATRK